MIMANHNGIMDSRSTFLSKEKELLDRIVAATNADEEDAKFMLNECDGDGNEAVTRLMDSMCLYYS